MGGVIAKIVFKNGEEQLPVSDSELKDIQIKDIDGQMVRMGDMIADIKVIMIVNVATK